MRISLQSHRRLIIVDYGLARRFRNASGQRIELRPRAGFRGTLRYVSIRVHDRLEQGPPDDLIALFFSLIELIRGELPWRDIRSNEEMKEAKLNLVFIYACNYIYFNAKRSINYNKFSITELNISAEIFFLI